MKRKKSLVLRVMGFLLILPSLVFANVEDKAGVDKNALMKAVSGLQMPFIENQGQIEDKSVRFYANTFAGTVFVTEKGEIVYSLIKTENRQKNSELKTPGSELRTQNSISKAVALRESLECPEQADIKGINKSETRVNYFFGSKDNWRTDIPAWQEVSIGEVYEDIELKLRAYGKNVEKLFTVYPKGSVEDIKLNIEGAKGLKVNKDGELEIETALGTVKMTKPVAYQDINGKRVQVAANYILPNSELSTPNSKLIYGFEVEEYDPSKPLIIDPLLASTYIGGNQKDYAYAIAIDSSGHVFVAGDTGSPNYPTTEGAYDTTFNRGDVFVSKLDSNLSTLLSSTFIGGSSGERAKTIAIDFSGDVLVAGYTKSSDYPTTEGAYDTTFNGYYTYHTDVFISKLDSNLSTLLSSTFIGGSSYDFASALAIDFSGDVLVTGYTYSSDYPTTDGAYDITYNGGKTDVFVSKLDSNLSTLLSSTFIGGSNIYYDIAEALAIDSSGNVFVAGKTGSSGYPTTEGAYDITYNGGKTDVFVSKLDSNLSTLLSSTFIGGSNIYYDIAEALAIDSSGNVFVAGRTNSSDYPTTEGAYDTILNVNQAVFVSKLDSNLSTLLSSTFIGSGYAAEALAIDSSGHVFVAGSTSSPNYPTTEGAYDTTYNGGSDVFVSKLDSNLSSLLSSTFIGGRYDDRVLALAIGSSGDVFIAGRTWSSIWFLSDYPTTEDAYDTTYNIYTDIFVSKLDNCLSRDYHRVSGSGINYPEKRSRASMSLDVSGSSPETGWLEYSYTRHGFHLVSTSITGLSIGCYDDTATIRGTGKVKGMKGYTFTATVTDGSPDRMGIEIYKPDGTLYFSADPEAISEGDFIIEEE